jgi:hypothetical protein
MKRFLFEVAAFLALQGVVAVGLESVYRARIGGGHYLAAYDDKARLLDTRRPPSVLLVGGSSTAFGVNSGALERAVEGPVLNLAVHAGLGLDLILAPAERALAPGDVVVVSPEYGLLRPGRPIDSPIVLHHLATHPGSLLDLPLSAIPVLLDDGLSLVTQHLHALWEDAIHGPPPSLYRRASFDGRGDFVAHVGQASQRGGEQHLRIPAAEGTRDACERLARFARVARERGARVVIVPPPIPADDHAAQSEPIARLWEAVARGTGLVVTSDVVLDRSLFFDTAYHLTTAGRDARTPALAAAVRAVTSSEGVAQVRVEPPDHEGARRAQRGRP